MRLHTPQDDSSCEILGSVWRSAPQGQRARMVYSSKAFSVDAPAKSSIGSERVRVLDGRGRVAALVVLLIGRGGPDTTVGPGRDAFGPWTIHRRRCPLGPALRRRLASTSLSTRSAVTRSPPHP